MDSMNRQVALGGRAFLCIEHLIPRESVLLLVWRAACIGDYFPKASVRLGLAVILRLVEGFARICSTLRAQTGLILQLMLI